MSGSWIIFVIYSFFFPPTKPLCWMDLKCCDKKTTKQGLLNIKCKTIKWSLLWERLLLLLPLGGHIQLLLQYVWYFMSLDSPCCWGMSRILLSVLSFSSNFFRFGYADPPPQVLRSSQLLSSVLQITLV